MLLITLSTLLVLCFLVMVGGIQLGLVFLCLIVASVMLIPEHPASRLSET